MYAPSQHDFTLDEAEQSGSARVIDCMNHSWFDSANSRVGVRIGGWTLRRVLGGGAHAAVFEASLGGVIAAMKLLHETQQGSDIVSRRFRREAAIAKQITHPNVVQVYDAGLSEDGEPYIVMELLKGRTLFDRLREDATQIQPLEALGIVEQLLRGLASCHRVGVLHRDIKPSNVFITESGEVKLFDFGIARAAETTDKLTAFGSILGTPEYMAPEQALGRHDITDERSDIFAVGALLYRILAGKSPRTGKNPQAKLLAAASQPISTIEGVVPGLPIEVVRVVDRALCWVPEGRFPNADSMLDEVHACRAILGGANTETQEALDDEVDKRTRMTVVFSNLATQIQKNDEAESDSNHSTTKIPSAAQAASQRLRVQIGLFFTELELPAKQYGRPVELEILPWGFDAHGINAREITALLEIEHRFLLDAGVIKLSFAPSFNAERFTDFWMEVRASVATPAGVAGLSHVGVTWTSNHGVTFTFDRQRLTRPDVISHKAAIRHTKALTKMLGKEIPTYRPGESSSQRVSRDAPTLGLCSRAQFESLRRRCDPPDANHLYRQIPYLCAKYFGEAKPPERYWIADRLRLTFHQLVQNKELEELLTIQRRLTKRFDSRRERTDITRAIFSKSLATRLVEAFALDYVSRMERAEEDTAACKEYVMLFTKWLKLYDSRAFSAVTEAFVLLQESEPLGATLFKFLVHHAPRNVEEFRQLGPRIESVYESIWSDTLARLDETSQPRVMSADDIHWIATPTNDLAVLLRQVARLIRLQQSNSQAWRVWAAGRMVIDPLRQTGDGLHIECEGDFVRVNGRSIVLEREYVSALSLVCGPDKPLRLDGAATERQLHEYMAEVSSRTRNASAPGFLETISFEADERGAILELVAHWHQTVQDATIDPDQARTWFPSLMGRIITEACDVMNVAPELLLICTLQRDAISSNMGKQLATTMLGMSILNTLGVPRAQVRDFGLAGSLLATSLTPTWFLGACLERDTARALTLAIELYEHRATEDPMYNGYIELQYDVTLFDVVHRVIEALTEQPNPDLAQGSIWSKVETVEERDLVFVAFSLLGIYPKGSVVVSSSGARAVVAGNHSAPHKWPKPRVIFEGDTRATDLSMSAKDHVLVHRVEGAVKGSLDAARKQLFSGEFDALSPNQRANTRAHYRPAHARRTKQWLSE